MHFFLIIANVLAVEKVLTTPIFLNLGNWNETRYDKRVKI